MHLAPYFTSVLVLISSTNALSLPEEARALAIRNAGAVSAFIQEYAPSLHPSLEKRKGGGGKGGSSGGGGSKSGGTTSSRTSSTSNVGGQTKSGSGVKPAFGGGKYYSGGATVPYAAGGRSPAGISPFFIPAVGLGFFGGFWLYGAYSYPYYHYYHFINRTETNTTNPNGVNTTLPVSCLCANYAVCGCDDTNDQTFLDEIIGNGSYSALNSSIVRVVDYEGNKTIFLNGTLENGTTAAGGVDDAAGSLRAPYQIGLWAFAGVVGYAVMLL